jgi:CO/xanthine dehydrogenase FAD-binding subunit
MLYHRPETLVDTLALIARAPRTILAGATDLYPATSAPELAGPILDITAIPRLAGISRHGAGLRIGACTPWSTVRDADLPAACDALRAAAAEIGGVQIQNAGTIGGNLCNASPAADGVPPLLALDAEVELAGPVTRRLPLGAFLEGVRRTARRPDEILTAVLIPEAALAGRSAFLKLGARAYLVISIAMVAARLVTEHGRIVRAALAVGACGPVATRLPALEARLLGTDGDIPVTPADLAPLRPIDDVRATGAYRLEAAAELLRRAIAACRT